MTVGTQTKTKMELRLSGSRIAPGLGSGPAWIVGDGLKGGSPGRSIEALEVEKELARIRPAVDATIADLDESARRLEEQFGPPLAGIFRAHSAILSGLRDSGEFESELRASLDDAETSVGRVFHRWHKKFEALRDETFQQRAADIRDLGRRVVGRLRGEVGSRVREAPPGSVLVVEQLLPSDVVALSKLDVAAVIVGALGQGAHASLLAREKGIPTVAAIPDLFDHIHTGDDLLVDGNRGEVIVSPGPETRKLFQDRLETSRASMVRCQGVCHDPARTLDRVFVQVEGNVGTNHDVELAFENGADGIGLLRTEQLYLARDLPPTEDELFAELRAATAPMHGKPITIRLLDVGGDKPLSFLRLTAASNPALGRRGVRLLLEYPELLRTQLNAVLRLSREQEIRVLVPMVTLEEDISAIRDVFESSLAALGISERPPFGAMIETPAAALGVAAIAKHVDFLSVGTNDLAQYTLAAARDDPAVNRYYLDDHPAIFRLLSIIAADAGRTPVSMCGELAGREEVIPQLLAIGFRSLSVAPTLIPRVKALIRGLRLDA
ncbi:phosphoenolpyruvate--protein phosphotransferase [Fimbriiglobus ruber]|uniref:Phosphoenolpyruvate-protein phosphotransferase n=1 Tax=Fimbriiglobus ruber TaxID=1908690 RepID=A0A225DM29_9BACT|nr:phosphoenolpyruvate--protein phosphotransferase [Fimbriiglobus ruber]OWK37505.1 Phosphoenolpyruvate-protein phosphotransferase of PTS system [Fimbriiglobus ruber]